MTLDEAIKKYENIAKYHADPYSNGDWHYTNKIMAKDYSQLAEWLKELKAYRERMPSYEAGYNDAKREIALSGEYERAYQRGFEAGRKSEWSAVAESKEESDGR